MTCHLLMKFRLTKTSINTYFQIEEEICWERFKFVWLEVQSNRRLLLLFYVCGLRRAIAMIVGIWVLTIREIPSLFSSFIWSGPAYKFHPLFHSFVNFRLLNRGWIWLYRIVHFRNGLVTALTVQVLSLDTFWGLTTFGGSQLAGACYFRDL